MEKKPRKLNLLGDIGQDLLRYPLIEVLDRRRVLVENHKGIASFSECSVLVRVSFGIVDITGTALHIACMTREQIVILGEIEQVRLCDKGEKNA